MIFKRYITYQEKLANVKKKNKLISSFDCIPTWYDVFPHNCDVLVSVRARLLMHKAEGVH